MENLKEGQGVKGWEKLNDNQKNEISAVVKTKLLNSGIISSELSIQTVRENLTVLSPNVVLYQPDTAERALRLTNRSWQALESYMIIQNIKNSN